jgi:hypothetical protein
LERGRRLGLIRGRQVERRLALGCSMLLDRMCPGGSLECRQQRGSRRPACAPHRCVIDRAGWPSFSL